MHNPMRSISRSVALIAALATLLVGCAAAPEGDGRPAAAGIDEVLAVHDLDGKTAEQIIDRLEAVAVAERTTDLLASVRGDVLVLATEAQDQQLPMPEDRTYISIAPYVSQTHECVFHSLTTCIGELRGEPMQVTVTDDVTGEVLVDAEVTTHDNGFVGLWLPRDVTGTIAVAHTDGSGTAAFSTAAGEATCITTLALT